MSEIYAVDRPSDATLTLVGSGAELERAKNVVMTTVLGAVAAGKIDAIRASRVGEQLADRRSLTEQHVFSYKMRGAVLAAVEHGRTNRQKLLENTTRQAALGTIGVQQYREQCEEIATNSAGFMLLNKDGLRMRVSGGTTKPVLEQIIAGDIGQREDDLHFYEAATESRPTHFGVQTELTWDEDGTPWVTPGSEHEHFQIGSMEGDTFVPTLTVLDPEHPVRQGLAARPLHQLPN